MILDVRLTILDFYSANLAKIFSKNKFFVQLGTLVLVNMAQSAIKTVINRVFLPKHRKKA